MPVEGSSPNQRVDSHPMGVVQGPAPLEPGKAMDWTLLESYQDGSSTINSIFYKLRNRYLSLNTSQLFCTIRDEGIGKSDSVGGRSWGRSGEGKCPVHLINLLPGSSEWYVGAWEPLSCGWQGTEGHAVWAEGGGQAMRGCQTRGTPRVSPCSVLVAKVRIRGHIDTWIVNFFGRVLWGMVLLLIGTLGARCATHAVLRQTGEKPSM